MHYTFHVQPFELTASFYMSETDETSNGIQLPFSNSKLEGHERPDPKPTRQRVMLLLLAPPIDFVMHAARTRFHEHNLPEGLA